MLEPLRVAVLDGDRALTTIALATQETIDSGWMPPGAAELVPLADEDTPQHGARWDGSTWTDPEPVEVPPPAPLPREQIVALIAHLTAQLDEAPAAEVPAGDADADADPPLVV